MFFVIKCFLISAVAVLNAVAKTVVAARLEMDAQCFFAIAGFYFVGPSFFAVEI